MDPLSGTRPSRSRAADTQQIVWQHLGDEGPRAVAALQIPLGGQLVVRVQDGLAGHAEIGRKPAAGW
jgi:hypothetical protein